MFAAQGKHAEAAAEFDAALQIYAGIDAGGTEAAQVQLALARTRWELDDDRPGAIVLAQTARDAFAAAGSADADRLAETDAWLAAHAP